MCLSRSPGPLRLATTPPTARCASECNFCSKCHLVSVVERLAERSVLADSAGRRALQGLVALDESEDVDVVGLSSSEERELRVPPPPRCPAPPPVSHASAQPAPACSGGQRRLRAHPPGAHPCMPALAHSGCAHGQAEAAPGDSTSSRAALMEELWRERTAAASLPAPKVVPPKSKSDLWRRYMPAVDAQQGGTGANCSACSGAPPCRQPLRRRASLPPVYPLMRQAHRVPACLPA